MKRALIVCMLMYVTPVVFGQVSVGVRGGMNASNIEFSGDAADIIGKGYMDPLYGWHADLLLNIPLANRIYLQPYFRYIRKGATIRDQPWLKPDVPGTLVSKGRRMELNYLELPLNVVYKLPVGKGYLTGGLGPYLGYGLSGRYTYQTTRDGQVQSHEYRKVRFSGGGDDADVIRMSRWDAGAHFSVGYEFFSSLTIAANCNIGMKDVDRSGFTRSRNQYVGLSVGFLFNREDY
ncbi:porin family protein [Chitinophaga sp. NPDC101104]|uniref:porin family protein n=1 Tax=Chitinophaga sp. NPDC101104 TaxID=3390561 RepID=UPI003D016085